MKKLVTLLFVATVLAGGIGCNRAAEQRFRLLEAQSKMLMTSDAQQGFKEVFNASFDPDRTRLLLGPDLEKWLQDHRPKAPLPEQVKTAIRNNQGAGLLIQQGLPGKNGGQQDVVYMRAPQFGFHRIFLKEDPDPCGDGNPAMCEYCSGGCGTTGCYCTLGCGACRPCPRC
jgi:hypothetical protein